MTFTNDKASTPIGLKLARVETIHVASGTQKIATLCLVLKDTKALTQLREHPFPMSKMIITDVTPLESDPTKVELLFRNLNKAEIIESSRAFLVPDGSLSELLKNIIDNSFGNDSDDDDDVNGAAEDVDYDNEGEEEPASSDSAHETLNQKLDAALSNYDDLEEPEEVIYSLIVNLADAHLAQMLCVGTNAPAFVITSDAELKERVGEPNRTSVWEDFIAILEFPYPDTPEYFTATGALIQAVTGVLPINIHGSELDKLRADIMEQILRLAKGSPDSLVKSFGYINPLNRLLSSDSSKKPLPSKEETDLLFTYDTINKFYQIMPPNAIAAIIQDAPDTNEYLEDIDVVNEIFKESGLDTMFNEVLAETEDPAKDELNYLRVPSKGSSHEELIAYYSAPITPESIPFDMQGLLPLINMPLLYDYNWASGFVEITERSTNVGEIAVAKLITVAIRFSRLKEITKIVGSGLSPLGFLMQALMVNGESPMWSINESVMRLQEDMEENVLFNELLREGFPDVDEDRPFNPEEILRSGPTVVLFDRLGHMILNEEWDKDTLLISLKSKNLSILNNYINELYEVADQLSDFDYEDGDEHNGPCPAMLATVNIFKERPDLDKVIKELGYAFIFLARLNAFKYTDHEENSDEWNEYIHRYLESVLKPGDFDPRQG
jgi:hypothetical protein